LLTSKRITSASTSSSTNLHNMQIERFSKCADIATDGLPGNQGDWVEERSAA
jgi:hypothetical protein